MKTVNTSLNHKKERQDDKKNNIDSHVLEKEPQLEKMNLVNDKSAVTELDHPEKNSMKTNRSEEVSEKLARWTNILEENP